MFKIQIFQIGRISELIEFQTSFDRSKFKRKFQITLNRENLRLEYSHNGLFRIRFGRLRTQCDRLSFETNFFRSLRKKCFKNAGKIPKRRFQKFSLFYKIFRTATSNQFWWYSLCRKHQRLRQHQNRKSGIHRSWYFEISGKSTSGKLYQSS